MSICLDWQETVCSRPIPAESPVDHILDLANPAMWGCITRLVACRRMKTTATSLLAHAAGLQCFDIGPAHVSSSSGAGGWPNAAQAAAATCQPCPSTSHWFSSSNLSSVADTSGNKQSHSNAEGVPQQAANEIERQLTTQIMASAKVKELKQIVCERGSNFNCIHTAAALVKFAKLGHRGQGDSGLLQLLPDAVPRACSNTLWACVNLSKQHQQQIDTVWEPTWAAFMQHVQRQSGEELVSQLLANAVYAAAKLRKQPAAAELQLVVQAFLQPEVLANATPQSTGNFVWAISQLSRSPGWQGGVSEQDMRQLLGEQQLQVVADGTQQNVSNVLLALARMAAAYPPLVERTFAQQCSLQLLSLASVSVSSWEPQHVANTMWATAELGLPADDFVAKAVHAAQAWVPASNGANLTQAAQACALLQYRDEAFLRLLLQQASVLLQQQQPGKARSGSRVLSAADRASLAAILVASITQLNMQQLAGAARDLVASSRVGQQAKTHISNPRRLLMFHAWLLQHQLLDGGGLTGLVTEQQLRQGRQDAAVYGTCVTAAQQ